MSVHIFSSVHSTVCVTVIRLYSTVMPFFFHPSQTPTQAPASNNTGQIQLLLQNILARVEVGQSVLNNAIHVLYISVLSSVWKITVDSLLCFNTHVTLPRVLM